jgi:hypothetical protein
VISGAGRSRQDVEKVSCHPPAVQGIPGVGGAPDFRYDAGIRVLSPIERRANSTEMIRDVHLQTGREIICFARRLRHRILQFFHGRIRLIRIPKSENAKVIALF